MENNRTAYRKESLSLKYSNPDILILFDSLDRQLSEVDNKLLLCSDTLKGILTALC